ncbi:hypothetical protein FACS1894211_01230 [Clostridia bacterium]|nr:hypothetical protein FACS1894211_01230 [Clostridia bacterium]
MKLRKALSFLFAVLLCAAFAAGCVPKNGGGGEENPPPPAGYTVRFETYGGTAVPSQNITDGGKAARPAADPESDGKTFGGWYQDVNFDFVWDFDTDTVTRDLYLYAKWTTGGGQTAGQYAVIFNSLGGTAVAMQSITDGGKASRPADPQLSGHTFGGWYKEAACTNEWNFNSDTVTGNLYLYAKWTPDEVVPSDGPCAVAFDSQGGTPVEGFTAQKGDLLEEPAAPERELFDFAGWYKEPACTNAWNFDTDKAAGDAMTLYANWTDEVLPSDLYTYYNPQFGSGVMPIGGYVAPFNKTVTSYGGYVNRANFQNVKNSGINTIYGLYDTLPGDLSTVKTALNHAAAVGISYYPRVVELDISGDYGRSVLAELAVYPAFGGVILKDEPDVSLFDFLGTQTAAFKTQFPGKLAHINLFPTYASNMQLGTAGYADYLNQFVAKAAPQVLGYDYYPLNGAAPNISKSGYFDNMSQIANKAKSAQIPFWTFIQSSTWPGSPRVATLDELYWQVNTTLAYGGKGIQYFTYWSAGVETPGFDNSFVDKDGTILPMYYKGQSVNTHIASIDNILMKSVHKGVIALGTIPGIPDGDKVTSYGALTSAAAAGTAENAGVLIGCFNYKGKDAFYAVNTDTQTTNTVTLNFSAVKSYTVYSSDVAAGLVKDGVPTYITTPAAAAGSGAQLVQPLEKGRGVLIVLN